MNHKKQKGTLHRSWVLTIKNKYMTLIVHYTKTLQQRWNIPLSKEKEALRSLSTLITTRVSSRYFSTFYDTYEKNGFAIFCVAENVVPPNIQNRVESWHDLLEPNVSICFFYDVRWKVQIWWFDASDGCWWAGCNIPM